MNLFNGLILIVISIIIGGVTLPLVKRLVKLSSKTVFIGLAGVIIGLIIGALLSFPLSRIPGYYGDWLPIIVLVIAVFASVFLMLHEKNVIIESLSFIGHAVSLVKPSAHSVTSNEILVDTSVLIDGRFLDIVKSGFICGKVVVPKFVLEELQLIADKGDKLKRERGRKGLETLDTLKNKFKIKVEVTEENVEHLKNVDAKLVDIAKKRGASIMTIDYNLNKVAKIHGVKVLNINELSNAVRPVFIPGDEIRIKLVQEGKERGQGVGYLSDGTMIVVEGGDKMIGKEIDAEVTRIFQTIAGKMIFAQPIQVNKQETKNNKQKWNNK